MKRLIIRCKLSEAAEINEIKHNAENYQAFICPTSQTLEIKEIYSPLTTGRDGKKKNSNACLYIWAGGNMNSYQ